MKYIALILLIILTFACSTGDVPESFTAGISKIEKRFIPDKRLAVFDVHAQYKDGQWHILGETTNEAVVEPISQLAEQVFGTRSSVMKITVLPDDELSDIAVGVVKVSVANLRKYPKHAAEMVDQAILGQELKVLKKKSYWYLVQTGYGYLGWVTNGSLALLSEEQKQVWESAEKVRVKDNYIQIFSEPNTSSDPVGDAVLGSLMKRGAKKGAWLAILLPDSVRGYVPANSVGSPTPLSASFSANPGKLVKTARRLLGLPYLWGGNSIKGLDCSGFTQTVFRENGIQLPRDANMQVELGEEILPDITFSNVQPGDLLFFGPEGRITHVGMSLGGPKFIHASGTVHINSLLSTDADYNEYRHSTLQHIRRIIDKIEK